MLSALIFALLGLSAAQKTTFSVDIPSGQFICPYTNRSVLFHGINAVEKIAPFVPRFNDTDLELLQTLGFNAVRLGVMWPAVEPVRGQYNYTYLNEMRNLVERFGQYGLFTIVDFHQDLLHPSLCGEGLPDFALKVTQDNCTGNLIEKIAHLIGGCKGIKDYGMRTDPVTGYPLVADCLKYQFSLFYATPDVSSAFQSFYTDGDIQQWFAEYWAVVANTFANSTYVLGYDLFNEPWPGMVWDDLFLLVGGFADREYLQPLYQKLHTSIRENDDNHIVFYEGVQFPDTFPLFGGIISPNGFSESPGGPTYDDRQGLSYHVYCCASGADSCDTDGNPAFDARCDKYNAAKLSQRVKDAQRVNRGGGFLTEFGGCNNVPSCIREIERTANLADQYLQSWTYWSYRNFDDITTESQDEGFFYPNGTLQYEKVRSLTRTYAQATQGKLISQSFNSTTSAYTLSYVADPSIAYPTEIFINTAYYYPNGFKYNGPPATNENNRIVIAPVTTPQTVVVSIVATNAQDTVALE